MSVQTPMKAIIRKGRTIFTKDMNDNMTLMCTSPDAEKARWIADSLGGFHTMCPVEHQSVEDERD